jgi:hypothetical protein
MIFFNMIRSKSIMIELLYTCIMHIYINMKI